MSSSLVSGTSPGGLRNAGCSSEKRKRTQILQPLLSVSVSVSYLEETRGITALPERDHDGTTRVVEAFHIVPLAVDAQGLGVALLGRHLSNQNQNNYSIYKMKTGGTGKGMVNEEDG